MSNPAFHDVLHYMPQQIFEDSTCAERIYSEMWTAEWWWDIQKQLPPGVTIAPVILASDKTRLSQFSGDKSAWPISQRATILLGCIPGVHLFMGHRLFHHCMRIMLNPLFEAGHKGVTMTLVIACCQENWCPQCMCPPQTRGDPLDTVFSECAEPIYQEPKIHLEHVRADADDACEDKGIRAVMNPFWEGLPHCDIFHCFTPDILHQLHKGMFKDHLSMPSHPSLRHFKKGISMISQWSGTEYKNMEKVFVGLISGAIPSEALHAAQARNQFHTHKGIFIQKDVQLHFQIPKIHSLKHYVSSIKFRGCADGDGDEDLVEAVGESTIAPPDQDEEPEEIINVGCTYRLAKHPRWPNTSLATIHKDFHALDFLPALSSFLKQTMPHRYTVADVVCATPFVPRRGRTPEVPPHFDTILFHYTMDAQDTGAKGYHVAHVRCLFCLPEHYDYPHPLACVEWYAEFREPVHGTQMYQISKSMVCGKP
ncbi:hypothetical protein K439DRAFT_1647351 [Ramaria rubella]|nr:hypothetical protein K439DRAFT_1647351 [Ramaria rubella]